MEQVPQKLRLLVSIVDRDKSSEVSALYSSCGVSCQFICLGRGTAHSDLLDYLGLGETEKGIVCCVASLPQVQHLLSCLKEEFQMHSPGHGIAFTLPLNSVGGPVTLDFLSRTFLGAQAPKEV